MRNWEYRNQEISKYLESLQEMWVFCYCRTDPYDVMGNSSFWDSCIQVPNQCSYDVTLVFSTFSVHHGFRRQGRKSCSIRTSLRYSCYFRGVWLRREPHAVSLCCIKMWSLCSTFWKHHERQDEPSNQRNSLVSPQSQYGLAYMVCGRNQFWLMLSYSLTPSLPPQTVGSKDQRRAHHCRQSNISPSLIHKSHESKRYHFLLPDYLILSNMGLPSFIFRLLSFTRLKSRGQSASRTKQFLSLVQTLQSAWKPPDNMSSWELISWFLRSGIPRKARPQKLISSSPTPWP